MRAETVAHLWRNGAARWAAGLVGALVVLAGCGSSPAPTERPALTPVALAPGGIGLPRAVLTERAVPRVGDVPTGPELAMEAGLAQTLEVGRRVVILGDAVPGPDGLWARVWVEPNSEAWPGDFYAWLPTEQKGRAVLEVIPPVSCPTEATLQTLAALSQQDRLICVGRTEVTVDGRTGRLGRVPFYDVSPAWYGTNAGPPIVGLFDPGPIRFGPGATLQPEAAGAWVEPHVAPGVAPLPLGLYLRVTGHFDDPSATTCRRLGPAGAGQGLPVEIPADSVRWCREQFVVTAWEALLGAEGRPISVLDPQLHRREFEIPRGVPLACAGVGMQELTVRIDARQAEPVWVEWAGGRSTAVFANEFRLVLDPPRVQATTGLTLVDGEKLDPDRGKPGLSVCPGGETIWFDLPQR